MPTTKKRIYITLTPEIEEFLKILSKRDKVPQATKAAELLKKAMEEEEDEIWAMIAEERDTKDAKYIPSKEFWANV